MPEPVDRDRLVRLLEAHAQLVEVLPPGEYAEEHLPAAVNLPLQSLDRAAARALDAGRPVIVYCWDGL